MSIATVLDRVSNVQAQPDGKSYRGSCPTSLHPNGDRSRGLWISEGEGGRTIIHCFSGCEPGEVVAALGLTFSDLFPERPSGNTPDSFRPVPLRIPARDLFEILDHELLVAILILSDIVTRRSVSESQVQRLSQAAARIGKARDIANPLRVNRHAA